MIPRIALGIARNAALHPVHADVIPGVPFVTGGNTALMSPDKRLSSDKLINVEFQRLGLLQIGSVEIHVVREIVVVTNRLWVRQSASEFLVPENVTELHKVGVAADAKFHRAAAQ